MNQQIRFYTISAVVGASFGVLVVPSAIIAVLIFFLDRGLTEEEAYHFIFAFILVGIMLGVILGIMVGKRVVRGKARIRVLIMTLLGTTVGIIIGRKFDYMMLEFGVLGTVLGAIVGSLINPGKSNKEK